MLPARKRKLIFIIFLIVGLGVAVSLVLYALRQNINLYITPSKADTLANRSQHFRLGGMVVKGTVQHSRSGLLVHFVVTDFKAQVPIVYNGVLPSLFREGQGIIAEGSFNKQGVFVADRVLAKHGANYHPPQVHLVSTHKHHRRAE